MNTSAWRRKYPPGYSTWRAKHFGSWAIDLKPREVFLSNCTRRIGSSQQEGWLLSSGH
jgi:hypothetical protein